MRVLLAVVTGYLIFAISAALLFQLTGQDPHATPGPVFGVASVVWGILFAALGGYTAVADRTKDQTGPKSAGRLPDRHRRVGVALY